MNDQHAVALATETEGRQMTAPTMAGPDLLIHTAIERGASMETMRELMAMRRELRDEAAREAYFDGLAAFQSACPTIEKRKIVRNRDGSQRYAYAPLENIVAQVRHLLREHGFSYRFETHPMEDGTLRVACIVQHRGGHTERSEVIIPRFQGQGTNAAQDTGSAVTYGRRYSFTDAFGITTADEDNDAAGLAPPEPPDTITPDQALNLRALMEEVGADRAKFLRYYKVDSIGDLPADRYQHAERALMAKRGAA